MGAPVFPRPQQVLPPPVAGHLVEDPAALQHAAGVDLLEVEAVLERGAVLCDLHHLASAVFPLIQSDPVGAALWIQQSADKEKSENPAGSNQSHPALGGGHVFFFSLSKGNTLRKRLLLPGLLCTVGEVVHSKTQKVLIHGDHDMNGAPSSFLGYQPYRPYMRALFSTILF